MDVLTVVVPTNGTMIAGLSVVVAFTMSVLEKTTMTTQEIVSMLANEVRISSSSARNPWYFDVLTLPCQSTT